MSDEASILSLNSPSLLSIGSSPFTMCSSLWWILLWNVDGDPFIVGLPLSKGDLEVFPPSPVEIIKVDYLKTFTSK